MNRFLASYTYSELDTLKFLQEEIASECKPEGKGANTPLAAADAEKLLGFLNRLAQSLERISVKESLERLTEITDRMLYQKSFNKPYFSYDVVQHDLFGLLCKIREEMQEHVFAYIPKDNKEFFENDSLLGRDVKRAFEDEWIQAELKSAGNCLAAELYTAAVFHLMRVAEIVLRVVAVEVGVTTEKPIEYETWETVIRAIKTKVDELPTPRGPQRDRELEFYHSMIQQLSACKDTWRNIVSHAREHYGRNKALAAKDDVQKLMRKLAAWLLQNGHPNIPRNEG